MTKRFRLFRECLFFERI